MKQRIALFLLFLFCFPFLTNHSSLAQDSSEAIRKVVTKVMPQYPNMLRSMNIQGTVRADVLVGPDGKVISVLVKGGHPLLAQSAETALRQWRWAPAPHETHESVEMIFRP